MGAFRLAAVATASLGEFRPHGRPKNRPLISLYNACRGSASMPCHYVIDKERRLVITTASGNVTFAEAMAHQDQLSRDPEFSQDFSQLLDATTVSRLDLSALQIRELARRRMFSATSRRALVANNPAVFGVGRMLQTYLDLAKAEEKVAVFYSRSSALKWLGLENDPPAAGQSG